MGEFTIKEGHFAVLKILNADIKDKIDPLCSSYRTMMSHLKIVAISKSTKYFLYNHSKQLLDGSALNRLTQIK